MSAILFANWKRDSKSDCHIMDWSIISEVFSAIDWATMSNIAVVIMVILIVWQLSEMRRTTYAQSYSVAREILQDEKVRQARKTVFQLRQNGKCVEEWGESDIINAEIVCHTYDAVGQMVRHKLLKKRIIIDSWGPSLRNSWPILYPLIYKYRTEWGAPEFWDDYEWLAKEAIKTSNKRQKKELWLNRLKLLPRKISPTKFFHLRLRRQPNKGKTDDA